MAAWSVNAETAHTQSTRKLLQSPGAFGDPSAFNSFYGDPWGTAGGYYDPYGPGYVPGFINIDVSQQYGTHLDFGPVAVDVTQDFQGFSVGNAFGAGWGRDGRGYNVQVGNGNVMDLSVTKDAGFGLWLFNGLVNVNIGPDGRWNMAPSAAAGGYGIASENGPVTVQGMQDPAAPALGQEAASAAAARMQAAPQAAPGSDVMQMQVPQQMPLQKQLQVQQAQQMPQQMPLPQHMQMPQQAQMPQQMPVPQQMQQQMPQQMQIFQQMPLPQQMQQQVPLLMQSPQDDMTGAPAARKACEGGIVVRVEDNGMGGQRYTCKYRAGSRPAAAA